MSQEILSIENGFKKIGNTTILAKLKAEIKAGEFVSILGPSGSGKTTLLRLFAGLDQWTDGHFKRNAHSRSAFVFQEPNLLGWRTVLENTLLPLELTGQTVDKQMGLEALNLVHLEKAAHLYPHELSGGMKMRASIARALVTKPSLLFMDEPFAALDEPTREELQEQLRQIWESQATTILFVTHSIQEAVFLANRIIYLDGKPSTITTDLVLNLQSIRNAKTRLSNEYFAELNKVRSLYHAQTTGGARP